MSQTEPTPLSPEPVLPSPEELEADAAELRADRAKTATQVEALLAACRASPRVLAKLEAFVDLAAEAGKKALGEAVERAPELLGHALGALLEGELAKRLPR